MEYRYKTKSVEERVRLMFRIMEHHSIPTHVMGATLDDIHDVDDWEDYPNILFTVCFGGGVELRLTPSGKETIKDVQDFMSLCGLDITSYEGLTIPKHKFV